MIIAANKDPHTPAFAIPKRILRKYERHKNTVKLSIKCNAPNNSVHKAITKAPGIYTNLGLTIPPYFPNNGLDINPARLKTPNTKPDWEMDAPFDIASFGKNGGSNDPHIPHMIYAKLTTEYMAINLNLVRLRLVSILKMTILDLTVFLNRRVTEPYP